MVQIIEIKDVKQIVEGMLEDMQSAMYKKAEEIAKKEKELGIIVE